jgi:hypothetical protein
MRASRNHNIKRHAAAATVARASRHHSCNQSGHGRSSGARDSRELVEQRPAAVGGACVHHRQRTRRRPKQRHGLTPSERRANQRPEGLVQSGDGREVPRAQRERSPLVLDTTWELGRLHGQAKTLAWEEHDRQATALEVRRQDELTRLRRAIDAKARRRTPLQSSLPAPPRADRIAEGRSANGGMGQPS